MIKLLVHNNNTSLNRIDSFPLNEQAVFDVPLDVPDVDLYINEELEKGPLRDKILLADLVFIKVSLSQNYLEYLGLRLAYHIRLSRSLGLKTAIPIVFIGEESFQFLGQTTLEPTILFTQGVYLIKENFEDLKKALVWYGEGKIKPLGNVNEFLKVANVNPPSNYQSHHSIANEWSILRWAKVLGISDTAWQLGGVKQNVDGLLYYKYLLAKHPIETEPDPAKFKIEGSGKLLYIDDEWSKGWDLVLTELFSLSKGLTNEFEVFKFQFKDLNEDEIVNNCKSKVISSNPDVVVLDLRLADSDFQTIKKTHELTGFNVLKEIKLFNPGVRVIIFTASNKAWNFLELQNAGANSFVLKESPELGVNKNHTKETIGKFATSVQEQLKYKFQKELFEMCSEVKSILRTQDSDDNEAYTRFIDVLKTQIRIVWSSIQSINLKNSITLDIAFLSCYNFLELFKKYYLALKPDYRYYLGVKEIDLVQYEVTGNNVTDKGQFISKDRYDSPSWFVIQAALFIDYFKVSGPPDYSEVINLKQIAKQRNDYIHSGKSEFTPNELRQVVKALHSACKQIRE